MVLSRLVLIRVINYCCLRSLRAGEGLILKDQLQGNGNAVDVAFRGMFIASQILPAENPQSRSPRLSHPGPSFHQECPKKLLWIQNPTIPDKAMRQGESFPAKLQEKGEEDGKGRIPGKIRKIGRPGSPERGRDCLNIPTNSSSTQKSFPSFSAFIPCWLCR